MCVVFGVAVVISTGTYFINEMSLVMTFEAKLSWKANQIASLPNNQSVGMLNMGNDFSVEPVVEIKINLEYKHRLNTHCVFYGLTMSWSLCYP